MDFNANWVLWIGLIGNIVGILGAIFAVGAWWQAKAVKATLEAEKTRMNRKIKITLYHGNDKIELPEQLRRSEFTRQEVLGRIGMVPRRSKDSFKIKYTNEAEFFEQLHTVMDGNDDAILTIPLTSEEYHQFDV